MVKRCKIKKTSHRATRLVFNEAKHELQVREVAVSRMVVEEVDGLGMGRCWR